MLKNPPDESQFHIWSLPNNNDNTHTNVAPTNIALVFHSLLNGRLRNLRTQENTTTLKMSSSRATITSIHCAGSAIVVVVTEFVYEMGLAQTRQSVV
jgi:hypothetical protein